MKLLARISIFLLMSNVLAACGQRNELTWTEDAMLPDGRVVTLTRWVEFKGVYALGDTPNESKQRLEFKHPDTGELVKWENSKETGMLNTVALMLDKGNLNILSTPSLGDDSHKFDCPNPPYLLYEYANGQWHPKPLEHISAKLIRANLTTHVKEKRVEIEANKRHLSAAQTSDSYTYGDVKRVPYLINFEGMPGQTFENKNCFLGPNINKLLFKGK